MAMKLNALAIAAALVALAACGSDSPWRPDEPSGEQRPDIATLEVSAEGNESVDWHGGSVDVTVKSTAGWTATCADGWCSVQPASGKGGTSKIAVNVAANDAAAERQTMVNVTAGNRTASAKILQRAKPELLLSATSLVFGGAKGAQVVVLKSNVGWSAASDADWCTLSPASGKAGTTAVTVSAERNASGAARQATITIDADGETATVSVTQSAS